MDPISVLHVRIVIDGIDQANKKIQHFNSNMTAARNAVSLVKWPALITGAGLAAQGMAAAGGGAVALGSALAPLAGLGAAGAVGLSAMGQAAITTKLAFMGVGEAVKAAGKDSAAFEAALAKLPPTAQAFTRTLVGMKGRVDELRGAAAQGLFPGLTSGLQAAASNFGPLRDVVAATAGQLGALAERAGALVGGKAFGKDFQTIGTTNAGIIRNVGNAAITAGDGMRHILVAAGPLTTWLSTVAKSWANVFRESARAGENSGRLAGFFEKTRAVLERLGSIIGHVATGLFQIGKAATPLGNDMLAAIDRAAGRFEAWSKSLAGQNQLRQFFADAKPAIFEIGRLIADVTKLFLRLGNSPGLAPMIAQVRTQLLPVLEKVISSTTQAFGPTLVNALTQILRVMGALAGSSGPLVIMVDLVGRAAGVLADLLDQNPMLQSMVVTFIGLAGAVKVIKLIGLLTGITKLISLMKLAAASCNLWTLSLIRMQIAAAAGAVIRGLVTVFWLLNAAMRANPVILIVTALIALGAALVYAYHHSETFRNIVDGAFRAVAAAAEWLWGAIKVAFAGIMGAIEWVWRQIFGDTAFTWDNVKSVLTAAWEKISSNAKTAWEFVRDNIIKPVGEAVTWLYGAIRDTVNFLAARWGDIKTAATTAWNAIRDYIVTPIRDAATWLRNAVRDVATFLGDGWDEVKSAAKSAWNAIKDNIIRPVKSAIDAVVSIARSVVGSLSDAWDSVRSAAKKAWEAVKDAITRAVRGALDAVKGLVGQFVSVGGDIVRGLAHGIKSAIGSVLGAVGDVVGSAISKAKSLLGISSPSRIFQQFGRFVGEGFIRGVTGTKTQISSTMEQLTRTITGTIGTVKNQIDTLEKSIRGLRERIAGTKDAGVKLRATRDLAEKLADLSTLKGLASPKSPLSNLLTLVENDNKKLKGLAVQRDKIVEQLKARKADLESLLQARDSLQAGIAGNITAAGDVTGAFSPVLDAEGQQIGTSTSAGAIIDKLAAQVAAAQQLQTSLATLAQRGLNSTAIQQIAAAGPEVGSATAAALLAEGDNAIAQVNYLQGQLKVAADAVGNTTADALYQAGIKAAVGLVHGLQSQQAAIEKQMLKIARSMVRAIKSALGIKSPSREFMGLGEQVAKGFALGIAGGAVGVQKAMDGLALRPGPPLVGGRGQDGSGQAKDGLVAALERHATSLDRNSTSNELLVAAGHKGAIDAFAEVVNERVGNGAATRRASSANPSGARYRV